MLLFLAVSLRNKREAGKHQFIPITSSHNAIEISNSPKLQSAPVDCCNACSTLFFVFNNGNTFLQSANLVPSIVELLTDVENMLICNDQELSPNEHQEESFSRQPRCPTCFANPCCLLARFAQTTDLLPTGVVPLWLVFQPSQWR